MYIPALKPYVNKEGKTLKLLMLGEMPSFDDINKGKPFQGAGGKLLLEQLMPEAGLNPDNFTHAYVFPDAPARMDMKEWTVTKTEAKKLGYDWKTLGEPINKRFLLPKHMEKLRMLKTRLEANKPDLIIAFGSAALWFLSGDGRIGTFRGTFFKSPYGEALATYHPTAVLKKWDNRPMVWADLTKVRKKLEGTLAAPLRRKLWINPTFEEIEEVYNLFRVNPQWALGVDIETAPSVDQITCISFSTPTEGICIPIWDKATGKNFWPTVEEEFRAWVWIERFARLRNTKILQNGLYDMQYLLDAPIEIRLAGRVEDTAILQHALQPELKKDLGTLASLYTNEPSWKQMRTSNKDAKADE